jgi:hypothetical protein
MAMTMTVMARRMGRTMTVIAYRIWIALRVRVTASATGVTYVLASFILQATTNVLALALVVMFAQRASVLLHVVLIQIVQIHVLALLQILLELAQLPAHAATLQRIALQRHQQTQTAPAPLIGLITAQLELLLITLAVLGERARQALMLIPVLEIR